jgi:RHS repeat-associated protein
VNNESATFSNYYPCYDANGNVTGYLDSDGVTAAAFEYDAFGNTISEAVSPDLHLPFRFSTKYTDAETGLVMYQLRAYNPELGRWVSRDPIVEKGFILSSGGFKKIRNEENRYDTCRNDLINRTDVLGLYFNGYPNCCCRSSKGRYYSSVNCGRDKVVSDKSLCECEKCAKSIQYYAIGLGRLFPGHDRSGPGDAVRHCVLGCQIAERCGRTCAIVATTYYEVRRSDNSYMDYMNNLTGIMVSGDNTRSCAVTCVDKLYKGELTVNVEADLPPLGTVSDP